ncbi:MAG: hypothetical protein ABI960_05855 [Candidatus Eisenbacteria bacterium]
MERVRRAPHNAPIEVLYKLGMTIADSLSGVRADGGESPIALMDDSTFAGTARLMTGFDLIRGEVEGALPDPDFFLALARAHGGAADVEAFRAVQATMGSGYLPVWIQQQTDHSGCTRFGTGSLVDTYAIWRTFSSKYPGRYAERAREELSSLEVALLEDGCACGDRASVVRELRLFLRRFPKGRRAERIRARLRQVESGAARIKENCISG